MNQVRVEAEGILHLMRCKKFIFVLCMLSKVLDICEITTKALQAPSQTISDVSDHVFALKDTLKLFHSEEHFKSALALSIQLCTAYEIEVYDSSSKRVKRRPQRLEDAQISSTTGQRRRVSCKEDLRQIYYEVIDIKISELDRRFQPEVLDLYMFLGKSLKCKTSREEISQIGWDYRYQIQNRCYFTHCARRVYQKVLIS